MSLFNAEQLWHRQRPGNWRGQSASNTEPNTLSINLESTPNRIVETGSIKPQHVAASQLNIPSPGMSDSALLDDGYSSISSFSTLMQLNKELEDRAFKSTPMRSMNCHQSECMTSKNDSGIGGTSSWDANTPPVPNTFWNTLSRHHPQYHQAFGNPQPTTYTGMESPLLQKNFTSTPFIYSSSAADASLLLTLQQMALNKVAQHSPFGPTNLPSRNDPEVLSSCGGSACYSPELLQRASRWLQELRYQEVIRKVREEMVGLIDNSMGQLELLLKTTAMNHRSINHPSSLDTDCMPLNLKANIVNGAPASNFSIRSKLDSVPPERWSTNPKMTQSMDWSNPHLKNKIPDNLVGKIRSPQKSTTQAAVKAKSLTSKRRRSRIRAGSRRLRVRQSQYRDIRYETIPLSEKDGTLDLRVRHEVTEGIADKPDQLNERTMILSASHLKRAKLMFLYARYPSSIWLKSFFPEVTFTRATTAQMVKWFSNFREFFYIQIEKWARQCKANGCQLDVALKITRDHELFQCLEAHYNRDQDFVTPEDFLVVTQVAVREFVEAVLHQRDRDQTWKKNIYKTVALLDKPLPEFLKLIK